MSIPGLQSLLLPVLEVLADGKEIPVRHVTRMMCERFKLSDEERSARIPSKWRTIIGSNTAWAMTYLKQAKLVDNPKWGIYRINIDGRKLLAKKLPEIDMEVLEQYPAFVEFKNRAATKGKPQNDIVIPLEQTDKTEIHTPDESIEQSYQMLREALVDEILDRLKVCKDDFFERLVVELLVAMGYGGSIEDAGKTVGKSGDGGVDGRIKEDRLGLDEIVIQAKRWTNPIGSPQLNAFVGSMDGFKARKGVFITTSTFSQPAIEYASGLEKKLVLIDGQKLAEYMIDFDIGVAPYHTYTLKRIDLDYYELEDNSEK